MLPESYERILAALEAKPTARPLTWRARCPCHEDRHPSLTAWVGHTGCLLARCWSDQGCTWPALVEALGTERKDWFPPSERPLRRQPMPIVATYDYRDAGGLLLYQAVRLAPKGFFLRRPARVDDPPATVVNGWARNLEGIERVPYRLPDLFARPDHPVLIVEGEADVESLRSLGLLATTNAGGAGNWGLGLGAYLSGRRCAIIPDNDEPGIRHACALRSEE